MSDRLPWFRCIPSALLGALSGMEPDVGYTYVALLLRIYETGGPVGETPRTLARRTGLRESRVVAALKHLLATDKIERLGDGRFDSATTHEELAWQHERHGVQIKAGISSAKKRAEKSEQKQGNGINVRSTEAQRPFNHLDIDEERDTSSLRSDVSAASVGKPARKRRSVISPDWLPSEKNISDAVSRGLSRADIGREAQRFRDHHLAHGKAFLDWDAAWRTWCGNVERYAPRGPPKNGNGGGGMLGAIRRKYERNPVDSEEPGGGIAGNGLVLDVVPSEGNDRRDRQAFSGAFLQLAFAR